MKTWKQESTRNFSTISRYAQYQASSFKESLAAEAEKNKAQSQKSQKATGSHKDSDSDSNASCKCALHRQIGRAHV